MKPLHKQKISWLICILLFFIYLPSHAQADDAQDTLKNIEKEMAEFAQGYKKISNFHLDKASITQQKLYRLASDDAFQKSVTDLWTHPNRKNMLIAQGIFFLCMILLKAWRLSKMKNWFLRFILGVIFNLTTLFGLSYVIPFFMLGEPFRVFTNTLWRVFFLP